MMAQVVRTTEALCPICRSRLPAHYVQREGAIYLERTCPEHGFWAVPVWRNQADYGRWLENARPLKPGDNPHCPTGCGLCADHQQNTCCMLLEITSRCNLGCRHCLADAQEAPDPSFAQVAEWLAQFVKPGQTLVQLSGGEPTLRADLPQIVAEAKRLGCRYVQLNTNGIRLAEDEELVYQLAEAGLSFVFLQFDGVTEDVYKALRGRPLLALKEQAIAHCAKYNLGVTLVPMLVPGINTDQVGTLIRYGVAHSPAVRGVHFQPVSYFGRSPLAPAEAPRYTLDELLHDIEEQSGGLVTQANLLPSHCDHPLCGLHGSFVVLPAGELLPLSSWQAKEQTSAHKADAAARNREFVGKRWQRPAPAEACGGSSLEREEAPLACGPDDGLLVASCDPGDTPQLYAACPHAAAARPSCCGADNTVSCCAQTAPPACCAAGSSARGEEECCCGADASARAAQTPAAVCCTPQAATRDEQCCSAAECAEQEDCCCNPQEVAVPEDLDVMDMEQFLARSKSHGFTITAMCFQDAATLDIERLRQCSLHVFDKGRVVPFCAYYL